MSFDPDTTVFLHNPGCSKSRTVKSLLDEREVAYQERLYLDDPLSLDELAELRGLLDRPAREWVRSGESAYSESGLNVNAGEEAHLAAIAKHPILLERPIVVHGGEARVGRPPTAVLELF
jgi:arsenate reductase (glutaredoxin)